ncbi:hypothetical protein KR50_04550 [Jeotgalibacillus campisalis]|uniref:Uncharacterized protein n=1 Tax=Jeotgalibacillus campisalis TaxID=220754 RepID=A0A0C2W965_9BACL|nr:hypothetical protein KR50_04550 [Jeotgalibacillus campisalis]
MLNALLHSGYPPDRAAAKASKGLISHHERKPPPAAEMNRSLFTKNLKKENFTSASIFLRSS